MKKDFFNDIYYLKLKIIWTIFFFQKLQRPTWINCLLNKLWRLHESLQWHNFAFSANCNSAILICEEKETKRNDITMTSRIQPAKSSAMINQIMIPPNYNIYINCDAYTTINWCVHNIKMELKIFSILSTWDNSNPSFLLGWINLKFSLTMT